MKHLKEALLLEVPAELLPRVRGALLACEGKPCPYCSRLMNVSDKRLFPTKDHIRPRSRYGKSETIIVCFDCNQLKKNLTLEEFRAYLHTLIVVKKGELKLLKQRATMINYLVLMGLK